MTIVTDTGRFRGCLLGLSVGDALETTVEFKPLGSFAPLTDVVGGGPFRLPVEILALADQLRAVQPAVV